MRNLKLYPITREEKLEALERAIDLTRRKNSQIIGNVDAAALIELEEDLRQDLNRAEQREFVSGARWR